MVIMRDVNGVALGGQDAAAELSSAGQRDHL